MQPRSPDGVRALPSFPPLAPAPWEGHDANAGSHPRTPSEARDEHRETEGRGRGAMRQPSKYV